LARRHAGEEAAAPTGAAARGEGRSSGAWRKAAAAGAGKPDTHGYPPGAGTGKIFRPRVAGGYKAAARVCSRADKCLTRTYPTLPSLNESSPTHFPRLSSSIPHIGRAPRSSNPQQFWPLRTSIHWPWKPRGLSV
jgi:hypothetical protein